MQRVGKCASFKLTDKDNSDVIPATLEMNGETETATFLYRGYEYSLRADRFIPKAYSLNIDGRLEKNDDKLKDAHLHTSQNRSEIEHSKWCYCIACQTIFKPEEVTGYADGGETVICPYCDCDAVLGDGFGFKLADELLDYTFKIEVQLSRPLPRLRSVAEKAREQPHFDRVYRQYKIIKGKPPPPRGLANFVLFMYKHLTHEQRYAIYLGIQKHETNKVIAQAINVSEATDSRDIRRNATRNGRYLWNTGPRKCNEQEVPRPR